MDGMCRVTGEIPTGQVYTVRTELPGLTHGEAVWFSRPSGERPTSGTVAPRRVRTDGNPLNPEEYLVHLADKGHAATG